MAYSFPIVGNMLPPKTDTRNPKPEMSFPKWAMQRTPASATKDAGVPKPEMLGRPRPVNRKPASDISLILSTISDIGYFCLLMIYRKQPGRAVSGEAAPGEQAPTGADWPGFCLSASFRLWLTVMGYGTHRREPRGYGDDQARRGKGYPQGATYPCLCGRSESRPQR